MCFAAGTKVSTPQGEVNIEHIKVGDSVYAYDFESGKTVIRKVADTPQNFTYYWVEVRVGGETIKATRGHLFWIESEQRWVEAAQLKTGMAVRFQNDRIENILAVALHDLRHPETTYNLVVDEQHDYFVGESQVLVHNGYPESPQYPPGTAVGESFQFNFDTSPGQDASRAAGVRRARAAGLISQGDIGHHINSVQTHPHLAAEPTNIQGMATREAHFNAHGRDWRNPTSGPLRPGCY
jgi:hypothetical protein